MPAATMAAAAASSQPPCASPSPSPAAAATAAYACSPKDALIAWYKGEFAAANAIIDALCAHLAQIGGGGGGMSMSAPSTSGYEAVFAAIHRRRINWIPVLQWQTYFSVGDVVEQLRRATGEQMLVKGRWSDARALPPTYQQQQQQQQQHLWHVPKTIKQEVVTPMDVDRHEEKQEEPRNDVVGREVENIVNPEIAERPTSTVTTSNSSSSIAAAVDSDSNDDTKADWSQEEDAEHPPNQTPEAGDEREIYQEEVASNLEKVDDEQQHQPEAAAGEVEDAMAVAETEEENKESTEEEYSDSSAAAAGAAPCPTYTLQIPDRHPSPSSDGDGDGASAGSSTEPHEDEQQQLQQHPTVVVVEAAAEAANGIICAGRHDECDSRRDRINVCKGFVAKEHNRGHMVNIVKGLKVYEDAFTDSELAKLAECINQLRDAGQNGQLSGETYILFNKQLKGNKREIIQFGVPVFQPTTNSDDDTTNIEPIPPLLQDVIDHLIQWRLIPAAKKPNGCIINFYEQDEHSQPYYKPPHLDNPLSTLLLHETTMAYGKALTCDKDGNYKGSLKLQLREGSLVVMRGNSADMARHVICPTANPRVSITFVKVRPTTPSNNATGQAVSSPTTTKPPAVMIPLLNPDVEGGGGVPTTAMGSPPPPHSLVPTWSVGMAVQATPILMLTPARPIPMNAIAKRTSTSTGTGVFLPWALGSKKYIKQLPPRIQKRRLPAMPQPLGMQLEKASQIRCLAM